MSWPEETFLTRLTKINSDEGERHTGCSTNRFLILTYSPRNVIYKPKMSLESWNADFLVLTLRGMKPKAGLTRTTVDPKINLKNFDKDDWDVTCMDTNANTDNLQKRILILNVQENAVLQQGYPPEWTLSVISTLVTFLMRQVKLAQTSCDNAVSYFQYGVRSVFLLHVMSTQ